VVQLNPVQEGILDWWAGLIYALWRWPAQNSNLLFYRLSTNTNLPGRGRMGLAGSSILFS